MKRNMWGSAELGHWRVGAAEGGALLGKGAEFDRLPQYLGGLGLTLFHRVLCYVLQLGYVGFRLLGIISL